MRGGNVPPRPSTFSEFSCQRWEAAAAVAAVAAIWRLQQHQVSEHQDAAAASGASRLYFTTWYVKEGAGPASGKTPAAPPPLSLDQSEKVYLHLATRTSSATLKTPDLMKLSSR